MLDLNRDRSAVDRVRGNSLDRCAGLAVVDNGVGRFVPDTDPERAFSRAARGPTPRNRTSQRR